MKINHISKIKDGEGDFLVLTDYVCEGIAITSQHETLTEAFKNLSSSFGGEQAIVRLCDTKEIKT